MSDDTATEKPDSLAVVVFSGEFDKVHYALTLASAAAATNTPATLFFTMKACRAIMKPDANGTPPWQIMPVSDGTETGRALDIRFKQRNVAAFEELMSACIELGVTFMVCEMGLRALNLARADLRDDIDFVEGGVVSFLNAASKNGVTLFI
ncbi:MAG: DsrE/DsrF/DrsH-like family protein [Rhodospirillales bacterium]